MKFKNKHKIKSVQNKEEKLPKKTWKILLKQNNKKDYSNSNNKMMTSTHE